MAGYVFPKLLPPSTVRSRLPKSSARANLVGGPCFSRGELDFSPAEKQFIPKGRALALDFRAQR
jgi:hypothetical protein